MQCKHGGMRTWPDFALSAKCAGGVCEMVEAGAASAAVSWRNAAQASLRRLGQSSVGLYQIHWPGFPVINNWATEAFVEGLASVQQAGLAKVGMCTQRAFARRGLQGMLPVCVLASCLPLPDRYLCRLIWGFIGCSVQAFA